MQKLIKVYIFLLLFIPFNALTQNQKFIRIEGHGFSASTLKPLPNVQVELWPFYNSQPELGVAFENFTDEGGFYRFEVSPVIPDDNGNDTASGYAFALSCKYREGNQEERKVQIMPLYSSLEMNTIHKRNFYMNVPESVRKCN